MSGVWRLLPCLGLMYVVWRHGGGAERLWSEKRSVLRCPMQRTALPLAARCNYGCSALHLKSGCSADSWGMGPASFSQRFPLLLSPFSVSSLISFHLFSHLFPLLLSFLSFSSSISFLFFSHRFPPVSVLRFRLHRIVWQSPAGHGAMQGFAVLFVPSAHLCAVGRLDVLCRSGCSVLERVAALLQLQDGAAVGSALHGHSLGLAQGPVALADVSSLVGRQI